MTSKDFIVTPFVLLIIYVVAYLVRPKFTDNVTKRYFIPGLTVKIFGALAVGFIYQFYYDGGDTFNFYNDSKLIWKAFLESPMKAFKLIFLASGTHFPDTYIYSSQMHFYNDSASYMVVCIAAFFGLFTFNTYSSIAVLFAATCYIGVWSLYQIFYFLYPALHRKIALAILFIPTVFFWGSGIFKDTITFGCLGVLTYALYKIFIRKESLVINAIILVISFWLIYKIKVYILLSFLPSIVIWVVSKNLSLIKLKFVKYTIMPLVIILAFVISYHGLIAVSQYDPRYSFEQIATTAKITAYDIAFFSGRDAGSTYVLGEMDGTFSGLLTLGPQAINVALFRPYLWEVKNPLMLLSALEALIFLYFTIKTILSRWFLSIIKHVFKPEVLFCLTFALTFAFATGISTYNFGSLSRYKIPMIPFYLLSLFIIQHNLSQTIKYQDKTKKLVRLY